MKIPGYIAAWKTALTRVDKGPIIIKNFVEEEHVPRQICGLFFVSQKPISNRKQVVPAW